MRCSSVYIILLAFLSPRHRKPAAAATTIFAIAFNLLSYLIYHEQIQLRRDTLIADQYNWIHHSVMTQYAGTFNENIENVYLQAVANGICTARDHLPEIIHADAAETDIVLRLSDTIIYDTNNDGSYPHHLQSITNDRLTGKTYLYLCAGRGKGYWFPTRRLHTGIREFLTCGRLYKPGFRAEFLTENFPPAIYKVGILNNGKFRWSSLTICVR